jgi:hypothetical protein
MYRLFLVICILIVTSCSSKKKNLSSEEVDTSADFVESFNDVSLPFVISDTSIDNKLGDSSLINVKLIKKFLPDSVFNEFKGTKPKYYAMGKSVSEKTGETYLFVKAATPTRQVGYILCFDKENVFKAGMQLVSNRTDRNAHAEGGMDRRFTINKNMTRTGRDGQNYYNRNVYVYNNVGTFTLILQESNEAVAVKEIYNPIDSMAMTGKWSGNYVKDKKNFVAIRDGSKANRVIFFVHFEANNGDCTGEIKGEAEIVKPGLARYTAPGDPCALEFIFTSSKVTISELKGCGNYRGIKCFFSGSYPKKIAPKKKKAPSKK